MRIIACVCALCSVFILSFLLASCTHFPNSLSRQYHKVSPAVVTLHFEKQTRTALGNQNIPENLKHLFYPKDNKESSKIKTGVGTGFYVSDDGYILTSWHLVENTKKILVEDISENIFQAKIIGKDIDSDLALLKVDRQGTPYLSLASRSKLEVGDWVFAIGAPFGFGHTMNTGVVSAEPRSQLEISRSSYIPFIQTELAINPGHSGGPLFNLTGQVVGVNSHIFSDTGKAIGLSFSIPADIAEFVFQHLKQYGRVRRGQLGITVKDSHLQGENSSGGSLAVVTAVARTEVCLEYGLCVGDTILKINDKNVANSLDVLAAMSVVAFDGIVLVTIERKGKRLRVKVPTTEKTG